MPTIDENLYETLLQTLSLPIYLYCHPEKQQKVLDILLADNAAFLKNHYDGIHGLGLMRILTEFSTGTCQYQFMQALLKNNAKLFFLLLATQEEKRLFFIKCESEIANNSVLLQTFFSQELEPLSNKYCIYLKVNEDNLLWDLYEDARVSITNNSIALAKFEKPELYYEIIEYIKKHKPLLYSHHHAIFHAIKNYIKVNINYYNLFPWLDSIANVNLLHMKQQLIAIFLKKYNFYQDPYAYFVYQSIVSLTFTVGRNLEEWDTLLNYIKNPYDVCAIMYSARKANLAGSSHDWLMVVILILRERELFEIFFSQPYDYNTLFSAKGFTAFLKCEQKNLHAFCAIQHTYDKYYYDDINFHKFYQVICDIQKSIEKYEALFTTVIEILYKKYSQIDVGDIIATYLTPNRELPSLECKTIYNNAKKNTLHRLGLYSNSHAFFNNNNNAFNSAHVRQDNSNNNYTYRRNYCQII